MQRKLIISLAPSPDALVSCALSRREKSRVFFSPAIDFPGPALIISTLSFLLLLTFPSPFFYPPPPSNRIGKCTGFCAFIYCGRRGYNKNQDFDSQETWQIEMVYNKSKNKTLIRKRHDRLKWNVWFARFYHFPFLLCSIAYTQKSNISSTGIFFSFCFQW